MKYEVIPGADIINRTARALKQRGVEAIIVNDRTEALTKIKEFIPKGASINNGSSTTLIEIGLVDYLKSNLSGWNNLHAKVLAEKDPKKKISLGQAALLSEYYLGSVHALAETGEMVIASASGSQLPHIVLTSPNLLFVVGAQKIVPTLEEGMRRLREYVVPLEDKRMKDSGASGTVLSKIVIFEQEPSFTGRRVRLLLVKEKLGF